MMGSKPKITVQPAGQHYQEPGWEWAINEPPTVVGWARTRLGAWRRARHVRRHPEHWPVRPLVLDPSVQTGPSDG